MHIGDRPWVCRCLRATRYVAAAAAYVAAGSVGVVHAAPPVPPDPVAVPVLSPIADPTAQSARLVPVPSGCTAPTPEQVVFVGTLAVHDSATARFSVDQVRSGSVDGFAVGGLIDVRYGDEVRFLTVDTPYIVSAGIDPELGVLSSRVSAQAPLFGGNEIAGVDDSDVACPTFEDPIKTLMVDNSSVESGVLSPLLDAKDKLLRAVVQPLGVAFVVLFGLVVVKHLVFALGRSLRDLGSGDRADRERRHSFEP